MNIIFMLLFLFIFNFFCYVKHFYMENLYSSKKNKIKNLSKVFKTFLAVIILLCSGVLYAGCSRAVVGYHVKALPNKVVYQIGEKVNFEGLKIESVNNDGTYSKFNLSTENISEVDTSTFGVKKVVVQKENMSVSFDIYVANVIVNDSDNIKEILQSTNDGDIVYLRAGNYIPINSQDLSYKDIVINKSLIIVGDGMDKTKFGGNFIVGANYDGSVFTKIDNFKNVIFNGIGFELDYEVKNNFINYSGPYDNTDTNGAIRCFDTQNLQITNCSFDGYAYGVLADTMIGASITKCRFRHIQLTAIKTTTETQNSTIFKNIFMDIATNVVAFDENSAITTGAISLGFATEGQKGVLVCKNIFTRIALHDGEVVYYNNQSKETATTTDTNIFKMSYMKNSAVISMLSITTDDLRATGIILSANNYGQSLQTIYLGANGKTVSQNGVISVD